METGDGLNVRDYSLPISQYPHLALHIVMNPDRTGDIGGNGHPGGFQRKMKADENDIFNAKGGFSSS